MKTRSRVSGLFSGIIPAQVAELLRAALPTNRRADVDSQVGVFVDTGSVFPDITPDVKTLTSLLSQLDATDVIFVSARFNLILSSGLDREPGSWLQRHRRRQRELAKGLFDNNGLERMARFVSKHPLFVIFSRAQLLGMIRWASRYCSDLPGQTLAISEEKRSAFAQALLIVNDLWGRRAYGAAFSSTEAAMVQRRLSILASVRRSFSETAEGTNLVQAIVRGKEIMTTYLARSDPDFLDTYRSRTGLSLDEYYLCLMGLAMVSLGLTAGPEIPALQANRLFRSEQFYADSPNAGKAFETFFRRESQSIEDLRKAFWGKPNEGSVDGPYDVGVFRKRPVFRAADGRAILMDAVVLAERAAAGPLFEVIGGNDNRVFERFGEAFESYCFELLRTMYPASQLLLDRLAIRPAGHATRRRHVEIADAAIKGVQETALIEAKGLWIREDEVTAGSERYVEHLREKYVGRETSTGRQNKGVAQLANAILKVAGGEWVLEHQDDLVGDRILPVLLVYDRLLDAPLHGWFFAREFATALGQTDDSDQGPFRIGNFLVDGLIVLTIDDLELLESSVENFALLDLLKDYSSTHRNRIVSVHNFIVATPKYAKGIAYSKRMRQKFMEAMNALEQQLGL